MSEIIPLSAIPKQTLSVPLGDVNHDITVICVNGAACVSITRDNTVIVSNARAVAGQWIIQGEYLEYGNFMFITDNDELPDCTRFGVDQFLMYATADELDEVRNG